MYHKIGQAVAKKMHIDWGKGSAETVYSAALVSEGSIVRIQPLTTPVETVFHFDYVLEAAIRRGLARSILCVF